MQEMHKKVIVLAVAGALAAPMAVQARAKAEVYGKVRSSVAVISIDDLTAGNDDSKLNLTSHASRFGIKGSQDINIRGVSAIYQLESQVDFDDNNSSGGGLFDSMRNTYVGLRGDFGTVKAGYHDTPYKMASGKIDVFSDTHADYNGLFNSGHDTRAENAIIYTTPTIAGFKLDVGYSTDLQDDNLPDSNTDQENSAISIAAAYKAGPFWGSLAFQSLGEEGVATSGANEDDQAVKLALSYMLDSTDLGFVFESADEGGTDNDQTRMFFSVKQKLGNDLSLKASLGIADDFGNTSNTGATFYALGVSKKVADKAELYAMYTAMDNDEGAAFDLNDVDVAGPGSDASALVVGINIEFSSNQ